ncbi:tape measure protein [Comamonas odontotermitis]|uniref:tape measure protein n=1 Tax=Comamonas odontotermitis TaxID=379895 RepID=UPI00366A67A3
MVDKTIRTEIQASVTGRESVTGFAADIDSVTQSTTEAGQQSDKTSTQVDKLTQELQLKSSEIKAGLLLEQSEIDLQNRHLELQRLEQQEIVKTAQARGNEQDAQQAQNRLRQIESEQLGLIARAKRAEALAIDQAAQARRQELAAVGPLEAAATKEIAAAENHARALRTEAAAADMAAARIRQLGTDHTKTATSTSELGSRISGLTSLLGQMGGALSAAFSFRELVRAAADMEQLRSGLEAVWRDSQQAGKDLDFVRTVASRSGADVREAGKAWLGLAAATKGTAVEGEPTRRVFESVATAMGKAGKSSAETSNALLALQQMASKGTIQMEELRGQLGEALPGALQATAKGLGLTTKELIDMVEAGGLTATDLFPALAKGLDELYGGAQKGSQTLAQEIGNLKNAVTDLGSNIGEAGGLSALKVAAELAQAGIVTLDIAIVAAGKSIGTVFAALASWDFSGLKQSFADIEQEAKDKLLKSAQHNELLRNSLDDAGRAALEASIKQQEAGRATSAAGQAASGAAPSWASLIALYSKAGKDLADMTALAEKTAAVKNAEASAVVALAAAYGTEKEQRDAQAAAAATQAENLERIAVLKKSELVLLENELAALQALGKEQIQADPARQKQLQDLEKEISLRRTVAEAAQAQAREARVGAEVAKAEADAVADNSGRLQQLADAYQLARQELQQFRNLQALGIRTQKDVEASENELIRSSRAYRDALSDQEKLLRARNTAEQAGFDLKSTSINLAIEQERSTLAYARATGNAALEMQAENNIRRLQIEMLQLTSKAKDAEAKASLALIEVKRAELIATGQMTEAKRLELDAATKAAQVKQMEAKIARETADGLQRLGQVRQGSKADIDGETDALSRLNGERERELDNIVKRDNMGHETRTAGTDVGNRQGIIEWFKGAGLDEVVAEQVAREFVDAQGKVSFWGSAGQLRYGGKGSTQKQAMSNAVDYYKYGDGKAMADSLVANAKAEKEAKDAKEAKAKAPAAPAPAPSSGSASSGQSSGNTYVSNITLGGQTRTVKFADSNSQAVTEQLLRDLTNGKGVAQ